MSKSTSSIYQKIAEKRANLEQLKEFRTLTNDLIQQLELTSENLNTVKEGTSSVATVLLNWQNVIQNIQLASLGLMKSQQGKQDEEEMYPEPLIRINLDKDQKTVEDEEEDEQVEYESE